MSSPIVLTDKLLLSLKPAPKGKRYCVYDAIVPGLSVRVTERGTRSFMMAKRWPGGSRHPTGKTLGRYPIVKLAEARERARRWLEVLETGVDPKREEERKRREADRSRRAEEERERNTFGSLLKAFCRDKKTQRQIDRVQKDTERACKAWLNRIVTDITKRDVIELVKGIKDRGAPTQAHNTFGNLQRIFNWAVDNDVLEATPLAGLRPKSLIGTKVVRQRVLTDAEIVAFWNGCGELPHPYQQMFRLLLLTGQRKVEVWQAKWGEFDLDAKLWTIPEERFKSGSVHRVPLSDDAIAILASCPRFKGGDYVFTAKNGSTYCNQVDRSRANLDKIMAEALGAPVRRWTLHDLRRTMRTRLSSLRIPTEIAEMCIGHGKKGLERIYNQHSYADEMREAMDAWAGRLRSIVEPPLANVVAMRG